MQNLFNNFVLISPALDDTNLRTFGSEKIVVKECFLQMILVNFKPFVESNIIIIIANDLLFDASTSSFNFDPNIKAIVNITSNSNHCQPIYS